MTAKRVRKQHSEIVEYVQLKAAAGGGGNSGGGSFYKPGETVSCKVIGSEPGGYSVVISKDELPGFLPTQESLNIGAEISADFVCVHNNRILLSARFSTK
ncbi:MAG: hypothetical protein IT342_17830 [Candidatus Melainabacteria bacterium]|nr:hypothetical protein [Candidatus Melainabacteria bacterium]